MRMKVYNEMLQSQLELTQFTAITIEIIAMIQRKRKK